MTATRPRPPDAALWRRSAQAILTSDVAAGRAPGPPAPPAWSPVLQQLIATLRAPAPPPPWWKPTTAFFGSVETRTDPRDYRWDGMKRLGPRDPPLVFFQFTLAGWGCFHSYGHKPQRIGPGRGFFAVIPSRHRYYLPPDSPGWTFGWIGIYHPYLIQRISRQVAATGPVLETAPDSALVAAALRLIRGAIKKDFRDRFDVELALFELAVAHDRLADQMTDPFGERDRLLDAVRARILVSPRAALSVDALAAEHGMSRSRFSHFFRARTGLTPARFMTEVRVQQAARMLVETHAPLKQVADACGFANANHFGKVFRRFQHLSPASYRQAIR